MIKTTLFFLLYTLTSQANEFQAIKYNSEKIGCTNKNEIVTFSGLKQPYVIYDKNSSSVKLITCEKIQIKGTTFYTALFSSEIREGPSIQKILTFEVALLNKKLNSAQTVRSEIIDEIELIGDLTNTNFDSSVKSDWGLSKKDDHILLKIEINTANEKPFSYLLKLNSKLPWLENLISAPPKTKSVKKN